MEPNSLVEFQLELWVSTIYLLSNTFYITGENRYEYFRLEKRIAYVRWWYAKQACFTQMSQEIPDVTNAFGMLAKEDTSNGFPIARPLERNSDFALYNVNSEGWF